MKSHRFDRVLCAVFLLAAFAQTLTANRPGHYILSHSIATVAFVAGAVWVIRHHRFKQLATPDSQG
jgi:membrane-bound metal-dependent hydrolase YbcI (DUF457 family)